MAIEGRKRGQPHKLSPAQWKEIIERYKCGERVVDFAKEFNVSTATIRRNLRERTITASMKEIDHDAIRDPHLKRFLAEARSMLWRADSGLDEQHPQYFAWKRQLAEIERKYEITYGAAAIMATKNCRLLHGLFRKFNVEQFDHYPTSHPSITQYRAEEKGSITYQISNENVEQTHRQNLNWAIAAAGEFKRTGVKPSSCPNDSAFFLYEAAINDPDKFLQRFTTVESKVDDSGDRADRVASGRSLEEITEMLASLGEEEEGDDGNPQEM